MGALELRKLLPFFLVFLIVSLSLSFCLSEENNWSYTVLVDGTAEVTAYRGHNNTVVIPSELDGIKVTSIAEDAFMGCRSMTDVVIPDSVTNISARAFYDCESLTSITIPESVKSINGNPFPVCCDLRKIIVASDHPYLSVIDNVLFSKQDMRLICYPQGLAKKEYTIPDGVKTIGKWAFFDCTSLSVITIPDSVKTIEDCAFASCNFASVAIPDSVQAIGAEAFCRNGNLQSISIPESVTYISKYLFYGCDNLSAVSMPGSVTSIGLGAFMGCESLTDIMIPGNVTSIGDNAFAECSSIKNMIIPDSVTSIGNSAFSRCYSMTDLSISQNVTEIGDEVFSFCKALKNVDIPSKVTSIGKEAFYACESMESISIPYGVTSIGYWAFKYCESVTSATIPDSVESIGEQAFANCSSLNEITLPASVTSIGDDVFFFSTPLTVTVFHDSYAEQYCEEHYYKYVYHESENSQNDQASEESRLAGDWIEDEKINTLIGLASYQTVGSIVTFGRYPQTAASTDQTPIEWIVLDYDEANHKALLVSKCGLDTMQYNSVESNTTWEKCSLRAWLNSDFINAAFNTKEQSAILITEVDNDQTYVDEGRKTDGGNNTQDQVFLLSYIEANRYFGVKYYVSDSVNDRENITSRVAPTAYAIARGAWTNDNKRTKDDMPAACWWLRSPGEYQDSASHVNANGSLYINFPVNYNNLVIRPAFWLDLTVDIY